MGGIYLVRSHVWKIRRLQKEIFKFMLSFVHLLGIWVKEGSVSAAVEDAEALAEVGVDSDG